MYRVVVLIVEPVSRYNAECATKSVLFNPLIMRSDVNPKQVCLYVNVS